MRSVQDDGGFDGYSREIAIQPSTIPRSRSPYILCFITVTFYFYFFLTLNCLLIARGREAPPPEQSIIPMSGFCFVAALQPISLPLILRSFAEVVRI